MSRNWQEWPPLDVDRYWCEIRSGGPTNMWPHKYERRWRWQRRRRCVFCGRREPKR